MINIIKIKNFQSHKKTKLELDKGVNVIIGSSDSGKTAILRAINLVINNRPTGNGFITHNEDECVIQLDNIKRKKNNKENIYEINDKILKAFGSEPPEEVKEIINFNDLNIQNQLDSPFLLSQSGGEVARFLNRIINLDIIDTSLKNIEKIKRNYKGQHDRAIENEEKIKLQIKQFDWIPKFEKQLNELKSLQKSMNFLKEKIDIIKEKLNTYKEMKSQLDDLQKKLKYENKINTLIDMNVQGIKLQDTIRLYEKKLQCFIYNKENLLTIDNKLKNEDKINSLIDIYNKKILKKQEKYNILYNKNGRYKLLKKELRNVTNKLKILTEKFEKEMGEVCLLCGNRISKGSQHQH